MWDMVFLRLQLVGEKKDQPLDMKNIPRCFTKERYRSDKNNLRSLSPNLVEVGLSKKAPLTESVLRLSTVTTNAS